MLVAHGFPSEINLSLLMLAVKHNQLEIVDKIIAENNFDLCAVDKAGFSIAHVCVLEKRVEFFRRFLDHATRLGVTASFLTAKTIKGCTLLHLACKEASSSMEILEILLQRDEIDINAQDAHGWTPLMYAVAANHIQAMQRLFNIRTCDINAKSKASHTALMISCSSTELHACTEALLRHAGIDVTTSDAHGWTALHVAARKASAATVRLLVNDGRCDVNARTTGAGLTPLHIATKRADTDVIKALLASYRCNPNLSTTIHKWTSMHIAAREDNIPVFQLLRDSGGDPTLPDSNGRTAVHKAFSMKTSMRWLLVRDRAKWSIALHGLPGVLPEKKRKKVSRSRAGMIQPAPTESDIILEVTSKSARQARFSRKKHSKLLYSHLSGEERVLALSNKLDRLKKQQEVVNAKLVAATSDAAGTPDGLRLVGKLSRKLERLRVKCGTVDARLVQAQTSADQAHPSPNTLGDEDHDSEEEHPHTEKHKIKTHAIEVDESDVQDDTAGSLPEDAEASIEDDSLESEEDIEDDDEEDDDEDDEEDDEEEEWHLLHSDEDQE